MNKLRFLVVWLVLTGCSTTPRPTGHAGPWDLKALEQPPAATWGVQTGLVREVYYENVPYLGKPTRVFAYYARPKSGDGPFPAMVLVHGGGGKAFAEWAKHWAERGYAALAMDLSGNGPDGRLPDGGPDQSDQTKFRNFTDAEATQMWTYHAVAAVLRGHSLLASRPEVDARRVGVTGISWGGYLTCIVAGLDARLRVAVPVYGCGFLHENSVWTKNALAAMEPAPRARWTKYFDPSQYLAGVACPILFLNGSNDFAYPLDSYQKSYLQVPSRWRNLSVILRLKHGHYWTFDEVDVFVDSVLAGGKPLPKLSPPSIRGDRVTTRVVAAVPLRQAHLNFTADTGEWQKRRWETTQAEITGPTITASLPTNRPLVCYLSVTDERNVQVSTPHVDLPRVER